MKKYLYIPLLCCFIASVFIPFIFMFFIESEVVEDDTTVSHLYRTLPMGIFGGLMYLLYFHYDIMLKSYFPKIELQRKLMPYLIYITWIYTLLDILFIRSYTYSWIFNMSLGFSQFFMYIGFQWRELKRIKQQKQ